MNDKKMRFMRVIWILVFTVCILLFLFGLPARFQQLGTITSTPDKRIGQLTPADLEVLDGMGISTTFYAAYYTGGELLTALPFLLVGILLFWKASDDSYAWLVSITTILFGTLTLPVVNALVTVSPMLEFIIVALRIVGISGLLLAIFIFPDGQFVPAWSRWLIVVWMVYAVLSIFIPAFRAPPGIAEATIREMPVIIWTLLWVFIAIFLQAFRYRNVSSPRQRQQSKWVLYGYFLLLFFLVLSFIPNFVDAVFDSVAISRMHVRFFVVTMAWIGVAILPISVGISILRFRLWDIDVIFRRTLQYLLLTVILLAVFLVSVTAFQQLFTSLTGQRSPAAVVISTLAIAGLFNPLRRRLQDSIDRYFNRQKYDIELSLADYAATIQNEVDTKRLICETEFIIERFFQPEKVSLWLRSNPDSIISIGKE